MMDYYNYYMGWLLCSAVTALSIIVFERKANGSYDQIKRDRGLFTLAVVIWPLTIFAISLALIETAVEFLSDLSHHKKRFKAWYEKKRNLRKWRKEQRAKLKSQPKAKPQKEYVHYYRTSPKPRTRCGVGKPSEVKKSTYPHQITCPVCLSLMEMDRRNGS